MILLFAWSRKLTRQSINKACAFQILAISQQQAQEKLIHFGKRPSCAKDRSSRFI